ncbi:TIGR01777 family oxidoreductase [Ferrimonas sp. SCSIO 43195]|uniref:TIGR01777 family oxidoreductase n=1 Tax=Ferrimonas sp. SCSIO 43195 TaxID=2822844 RepID=UPI002075E08B|nr:TIGR01777 family oxidoreductase [Ferrimonas sp. SCSIO 43195]USD38586.1 TIGR01777 family oxidoreductase [Ferrimonas sp. SCSIO 43195]
MKIVISGGSGFVGLQLLKQLQPNHQLVVISRNPKAAKHTLSQQGVEAECIDIDGLVWQKDVDAVINLAGEPIADKRWSSAQKHRICDSRWRLTQTLSDWILAQPTPPSVFISASAIGIYGNDNQAVDENTPLTVNDADFAQKVCHTWETLALQAQGHTRVCLLRIGLVLGEGGALKKMLPAFRAGLGGPIGSGEQMMSWIHIDDLVAAIGFLLINPESRGVYNGTGPLPVSNRLFTRTLGKVLHRPAVVPVPALALKLGLGEMSQLLLEGQRVLPTRLQQDGFEFHYPGLEGALTQLLQPPLRPRVDD